jgi:hypothetical protein
MKCTPLALAAAIALSAAGAGFAQPASPPAPPAGEDHAWRGPDPAKMPEHLRAVLQLRPDQEPALNTFVAALQPTPDEMQRRRAERAEMRGLTTPQRLDRMQARQAERQAAFARRADAIKRFYAQLTPAQQKAFDALPMGPGGMHGGMRGRRHGGPEHGGHGFDGGKSAGPG